VASGHLEIEVADQGIGIPPEDVKRVFDKFYRVQRPGSVSGTGLGLSICYSIARQHGAELKTERRAGGGAVFKMIFKPQERKDG
jgi:two-component system sensor histidine kinase KdpD